MSYFPQQNTLQVGGMVFTNFSGLLVLAGYVSTNGATYTTLRRIGLAGGASAGYTPSGSNNFRVWAIKAFGQGSTASQIRIFQTNNDAGLGGGTATSPVYFTGDSSYYNIGFDTTFAPTIQQSEIGYGPTGPLLQNTRYLTFNTSQAVGSFVQVFGYEEAP